MLHTSRAKTLENSRRFQALVTPWIYAEHIYESLVRAFEWVCSVTAEVLVDKQKAAEIRHRIGDTMQFNVSFVDLRRQCGSLPMAYRSYPAPAETAAGSVARRGSLSWCCHEHDFLNPFIPSGMLSFQRSLVNEFPMKINYKSTKTFARSTVFSKATSYSHALCNLCP